MIGILNNNYKKDLITLHKLIGVDTIDIHDKVFSDSPNPVIHFTFKLNGHYTVDIYNAIGKLIKNIIKQNI